MVHGGSGGASGGANGTGHGGTRRNEQQPNLPGNATPYDGGSSVDLSSHGGGSGPGYQGTEAHWESPIFSDPIPTYPNPFPTGY